MLDEFNHPKGEKALQQDVRREHDSKSKRRTIANDIRIIFRFI